MNDTAETQADKKALAVLVNLAQKGETEAIKLAAARAIIERPRGWV